MSASRAPVLFVLPPGGLTPHFGEHLGTAFLRAVLAADGITSLQYLPRRNVGLTTFALHLRELRPNVVGFTAYESNLRACRALAGVVRETLPEAVVMVGGPNATFSPEETLRRVGADVCLRGAGEATISGLVGAVLGGRRPRARLQSITGHLPSLVLRTGDGPSHTRLGDLSSFPGDRFRTLDELPSPYSSGFVESADVGLLTSRGCNQSCTYCSFAEISGRRVHHHSVERVLDDLAALVAIAKRSTRPAPVVPIFDDAFTLSPARAWRICEGILERNLRVRLICETRADTVDASLLRLMKRAGFVGISFGLESAVPRVLRAIGKVQRPDTRDDPRYERERAYVARVRRAVREAKRAGLKPSLSVIGGLPRERPADFRKTLAVVDALRVDEYAHNELTLLPGTPLFATRAAHGIEAGRDAQTGRWRTRHAFDVRSVRTRRGALTIAARRTEARDLADALCGRERPDRACDTSAWAIIVHDRRADAAVARWLRPVLAVNGVLVVTAARGATLDEHDAWLAALERARVAYGSLGFLTRARTGARSGTLRSMGTKGVHDLRLSALWTDGDVTNDRFGNHRVPIWLSSLAPAPPRATRVPLLAAAVPQVADACRWWSHTPRCSQPPVLHVWPDLRVTACWGGPSLGEVGDGYSQLAARGRELACATGSDPAACPMGRPAGRDHDVGRLELASVLTWMADDLG